MAIGHAQRAMSFGTVAEQYDRYRPAPPPQALDWLLPAGCRVAVDVGAGTGALTRLLVDRVDQTIAVEPDPRMRAVLASHVPAASVLAGRGEALPVADGVADAVLVASAWHWLDPQAAVVEIARVLRPGGCFGLLWNRPERDHGWMEELWRVIPQREDDGSEMRSGRRPGDVRLPEGSPFGPAETHAVRWSAEVTRDELIGLLGTYSRVITLPNAERDRVNARAAEVIASHPELAGRERIALAMVCNCWRAVRS